MAGRQRCSAAVQECCAFYHFTCSLTFLTPGSRTSFLGPKSLFCTVTGDLLWTMFLLPLTGNGPWLRRATCSVGRGISVRCLHSSQHHPEPAVNADSAGQSGTPEISTQKQRGRLLRCSVQTIGPEMQRDGSCMRRFMLMANKQKLGTKLPRLLWDVCGLSTPLPPSACVSSS